MTNNRLELKEGFLLQIDSDRYLLGGGPLSFSNHPDPNKWSLFHPPFFYSCDVEGTGHHIPIKTSFVQKGNKNSKAFWCIPTYTALLSKKELMALFKNKNNTKLELTKWQGPSFSLFQTQFSQALEKINQGCFKKVVPVFFETASFGLTEQKTKALLYRLLSTHSDMGRAYALWFKDRAIMGQTPEYLFQTNSIQSKIHTMALAGTARDPNHNLLRDPKERQEHKWVVQGIQSVLSSLGGYNVFDPYVFSVGPIQHLRTDFTLKPKRSVSFQELCLLLHPTPALGGFPKKPAWEWLLKWEHEGAFSRYGFGAPFGVLFKDKAFCLVAIRNTQFIEGKAYVGSGCGLVQGSHITTEWREGQKKRNFIKKILF